jgi:hypothetical protein
MPNKMMKGKMSFEYWCDLNEIQPCCEYSMVAYNAYLLADILR